MARDHVLGRLPLLGTVLAVGFAAMFGGCGGAANRDDAQLPTPVPTPDIPSVPQYVTDQAGTGRSERVIYRNGEGDPLRIAAGAGHVVAVVGRYNGSSVVDVTDPRAPRTLARFAGGLASPEIGTDADGRPVVIVSPCRFRKYASLPACGLESIDLASGAVHRLPGTTDAQLGDMDHGRIATAKVGDHGVRFAVQAKPGGPLAPLPLTSYRYEFGFKSARWHDDPSDHVESMDFARDVLAVSVLSGNPADGGGSTLLARPLGKGWTRLGGTSYGLMDGIEVDLQGVQVTPSGIRAFCSGGPEQQPYMARWDEAGHRLQRIGVKSRLGYTVSAAFDGDHLVTTAFDPENGPPDARSVVRSGPYAIG